MANVRAELEADPALAHYYNTLFLPMARALSRSSSATASTSSLDKIGYAIGEFTMQRIKAEAERAAAGSVMRSSIPARRNSSARCSSSASSCRRKSGPTATKHRRTNFSLKKLRYIVETEAGWPQETKELVNNTLLYREAVKMLGTYLEKYADKVLGSPDGRLHFWYSLIGSVSRSSSDGQQIPRDKRVRNIVAPPPGKVIVRGDFSQMELRMAAHLSQDPELLRVYRTPGGDIHRSTAAAITGKLEADVTDKERSDAKPWNFSLLYGAEEYTVES